MIPDSTASDYVLHTAAERGIRFVRLWFPDVLGLLKSCAIPVSELERALEEGVGIDGSSLESGARLIELDAIAQPDPTTFEVVLWRPAGDVARMFCDVVRPDGSPFGGDSREALRRQLAKAAALGFTFQVGPELEFHLFADRTEEGVPQPLEDGSYFDLTPSTRAATSAAARSTIWSGWAFPSRRRTTRSAPPSTTWRSSTATRSRWPTR